MIRFVSAALLTALVALPVAAEAPKVEAPKVEAKVDAKAKEVKVESKDASAKVSTTGTEVKTDGKTATVAPGTVAAADVMMHDCTTTPELVVKKDQKVVAKGACKKVTIEGNNNDVQIEKTAGLTVGGNTNKVRVMSVEAIAMNGKDNEVVWTETGVVAKAEPEVKNKGKNNNVKKFVQVAVDAAATAGNIAAGQAKQELVKKEDEKAAKDAAKNVKDAAKAIKQ